MPSFFSDLSREILVGSTLWILAGLLLAMSACRAPPEVGSPYACTDCNLLLISIDTLRADHLGTYGYSQETSPNIDEWARQSVVFERAFSTAEKTTDSHMSIFTGLHPSSHRILNTNDPALAFRLPESIETLTEVLKAADFATGGFHGGGNVDGSYGFDRGFDVYRQTQKFFTHPSKKVDLALQWLEERQAERFFLFFHTYFVHDPYIPTGEFAPSGAADGAGPGQSDLASATNRAGLVDRQQAFPPQRDDGPRPKHEVRAVPNDRRCHGQ